VIGPTKILQFERIILAKPNVFWEKIWSPPILVRRRSPDWLIDDSPDHNPKLFLWNTRKRIFRGFHTTPAPPHRGPYQ